MIQIAQPNRHNEDKSVWYFIIGYFCYVIALLPFAYLITFVQEYDTGSTAYLKIYERDTYYTTYFSFGKLFYWMVLAVIGFSFVVVVNLGNVRRTPFTSSDGSFKDIKTLIPVAFSLFVISSIMFLRDKYDMQRDCSQVDPSFVTNAIDNGIIQSRLGGQLNLNSRSQNYSGAEMDSFGIVWSAISEILFSISDAETKCHIYSRMEMFKYNYFYLIVYFIGLNFTHLDNPPFNQITLEWDIMKNWPWYLWLIFLGIIGFIMFNVGYLFTLYK